MADPDYQLFNYPGAIQGTSGNTYDQWLRKWCLTLSRTDGGGALAITTETAGFDLRMKFEITRADKHTPGTCTVTIYNLSDETAMAVIREFSKLNLQAGYMTGHYGIIFEGTIKQFKKGRESAIDSYLQIFASDGDIGYAWGIVSSTLPAGWKTDDMRDKLVQTYKGYGQEEGNIGTDPNGGVLHPRPATMWGSGVDEVEAYTATTRQTWSVQNGKIQILQRTAYAPGDMAVINAGTGMVGVPEVTQDGIEIQCLLNANLFIKQRVQLDNRTFNQMYAPGPGLEGLHGQTVGFPSPNEKGAQYANTANDGVYCIVAMDHVGDTRGLEWYTRLTCWACDPSQLGNASVMGQQNQQTT